jgi:O-antigen ligase
MSYHFWEALTKWLVILSILGAEITQDLLAIRQARFLPLVAVVVFFAALVTARRYAGYTLTVLLLFLYIVRSLGFLLFQHLSFLHFTPLTAGLLGVILSQSTRSRWYLPRPWQFPLVLWALIVALSWPILFLRELDFVFPLSLDFPPLANNANGLPSDYVAPWVVQIAVIQGIGLLWIDWLFAAFPPGQRERFQRFALMPLALSFCLTSLVALYQAFVDITFLNSQLWIGARRATGAMFDGNPFGILAACWGPALLALFFSQRHKREARVLALLLPIPWLAMIVSGSTSALLIAGPSVLCFFWLGWKTLRNINSRALLLGSVGSLCLIGGVIWLLSFTSTQTPFARLYTELQKAEERSLAAVVEAQLRDRPFFAQLAARITADTPLTGIGLGSFNVLANDYARKYGMAETLNFDNALNWYAHQLSELGLLGSVAWVVWIIVFVRTLLLPPVNGTVTIPALLLKVLLVGFGLASLFGVHAQNPEMLLTFWTFTFWLATYFPNLIAATPPERNNEKCWITMLAIACLYTILQGYASATTLRISSRAAMAGWEYQYGFHAWEEWSGVGPIRWTHRRATTRVPVQGTTLFFRAQANHPDIEIHPVEIQVFVDGQLVTTTTLYRPHTLIPIEVPLPQDTSHVTLTIHVDRTWRPIEYGYGDPRSLGVAVTQWTFSPLVLDRPTEQR